jgi:two-component system chemotaxis response regulator CheY
MPKTILVVDDQKSIRSLLVNIFKVAGYDVVDAEDGEKALTILTSGKKVDLIITDLNMPIMNGIEFIWEVRKLSSHLFTPIFMLTTEAEKSRLSDFESVSTEMWLEKPIQPVIILNNVTKILPP